MASKIPTTKAEVKAWVEKFYAEADALDAARFAACFAKDGIMQFGNNPVVYGREGIQAGMAGALVGLEFMKHSFKYGDIVDGKTIYHACSIRYRIRGDSPEFEVEIPGGANFFLVTEGEEAGLIQRFDVFINNQPVLDRAQAVAAAK